MNKTSQAILFRAIILVAICSLLCLSCQKRVLNLIATSPTSLSEKLCAQTNIKELYIGTVLKLPINYYEYLNYRVKFSMDFTRSSFY